MLATYQGASQRRGLWRPLHLEAQPDQGRLYSFWWFITIIKYSNIHLVVQPDQGGFYLFWWYITITKYSNNHLVVQPARGRFYSF